MNIIVHGSYYSGNFGDTLLVKLTCMNIKQVMPDANIYLACEPNRVDRKDLNYPIVNKDIKIHKIVFTGGGYLGEQPGNYFFRLFWSLRNYYRHIYWLRNYKNTPYGFFGVGVGPLNILWFRKIVIDILRKSEIIMVRDSESRNFLTNYDLKKDVHVIADIALQLKEEKNIIKHKTILLHLPSTIPIQIKRDLYKELKFFYHSGYEIQVIADSNNQNKKIDNDVYGYSYFDFITKFHKYESVEKLINIIKSSEVIISTKLHASIVGIATNVKVISLAKHPKNERLFRQLDIGEYLVPLYKYDSSKLKKAFEKLNSFDDSVNRKYINKSMENYISNLDDYIRL